MIKGVINGYYRTGTSIVWWILQQSNPNKIILYEPHSCGLHDEIRTFNPNANTVNPLHGMPIYKPYYQVPEDVRKKFLIRARPCSIYTKADLWDAIETVEMFHEIDMDVYIQSNQLHLILNEFCEHFGCNYIHIVRDPAEVLFSHAGSPSKLKQMLQELLATIATNYMIRKWIMHGKRGKFELGYCMLVARRLGFLKSGDYLTKFLSMYINYNYHVFENLSKSSEIFKFETIVKYPSLFEYDLVRFMNLKFNKHGLLDPNKAFRAPTILKRAIKRRLDGDLREKLEMLGYSY